jgi:hypothetical protein
MLSCDDMLDGRLMRPPATVSKENHCRNLPSTLMRGGKSALLVPVLFPVIAANAAEELMSLCGAVTTFLFEST